MGKMNNLKKKRLMRRNMVGYSFIAANFHLDLVFVNGILPIRSSLLVYRILLDYCQMIPFGFL